MVNPLPATNYIYSKLLIKGRPRSFIYVFVTISVLHHYNVNNYDFVHSLFWQCWRTSDSSRWFVCTGNLKKA